jgi:uncharacterized protein Veg
MNIDKIKLKVKELSNEKLNIKVYIGRNKYEYYEGIIDKIYNNIFTIKTNKGIKSFSYADVATKIVVLSKIN